MAVDGDGFVHVAAAAGESAAEQGIWYLTNRGGPWATLKVASPRAGGHESHPSLAVDSDGSVWIAFTQWPCRPYGCELEPIEGIFYVTNASGHWADPVLLVGSDFDFATIAVRDGVLQAAYIDACHWVSAPECSYPVYFGTTRGGSWASELVFEESGSGAVVLGLDDSGAAQIMVEGFVFPPETIKAAFETSGFANERVWRFDDLAAAWPLLLRDDPSGSVTAVWGCLCEAPDADLYLATRSGGSWRKANVVLRGPQVTSAAFAEGGMLVVVGVTADSYVYADDATGSFRQRSLAAINARAWDWGPPGSPGSMALALDGSGRPHIVYIAYDQRFDTSLWYVEGPAPAL